jgi:glutaredoxin
MLKSACGNSAFRLQHFSVTRQDPRMPRQAILYTRQGCHLCEQAHEILKRYAVAVQTVDIDSDPALLARYDVWVPVVAIDGQERFRGRIDERLLRRLLEKMRNAEC